MKKILIIFSLLFLMSCSIIFNGEDNIKKESPNCTYLNYGVFVCIWGDGTCRLNGLNVSGGLGKWKDCGNVFGKISNTIPKGGIN